jgi:hypothetical protein
MIVSGPAHGTLNEFNADGSFEYDPDTSYQGDDSFTYQVSDGVAAAVATVFLTVGGPALPTLSIADASATEGDPGGAAVNATFTITLSAATGSDVTVHYEAKALTGAAADVALATPGEDFQAVSGTATITASTTSTTVVVPILADLTDEYDERFVVVLTDPSSNALLADDTGDGTIEDNDPLPNLTISEIVIVDRFDASAKVTLSIDRPTEKANSADFRTIDGTATHSGAFEDYQETQHAWPTLFGPTETEREVDVWITRSSNQASERFSATVYNVSPTLNVVSNTANITVMGVVLRSNTTPDSGILHIDEIKDLVLDIGDVDDLEGYFVELNTTYVDGDGSPPLLWEDAAGATTAKDKYVIGTDDIPTSLFLKPTGLASGYIWARLGTSDTYRYKIVQLRSVKELDYHYNHALLPDPDANGHVTSYSNGPEWKDQNLDGAITAALDRAYPVAYTRGRDLVLDVTIAIDEGAGIGTDGLVWIWGKSSTPGIGVPQHTIAHLDGGTGTIKETLVSAGSFVNKVDFIDSLDIEWYVSFDRETYIPVGTTSTPVYLTYADPELPALYHSLVHIGSVAAKGESDENGVFQAIWDNSFAKLDVHKVDPTFVQHGVITEGDQLIYYGQAMGGLAMDWRDLLLFANGQCGAWQTFFIAVLRAQGITTANMVSITPSGFSGSTWSAEKLLIKNWNFQGPEAFTLFVDHAYIVEDITAPAPGLHFRQTS